MNSARTSHSAFKTFSAPLARLAAASLCMGAFTLSTPAVAGGDSVAGTLFGAGAGVLLGQAFGGQQGAVVGGVVGAVAGHAIASADRHPQAAVHYSSRGWAYPYAPPPPVVTWGAPTVVYPPHAVVVAPRPHYYPVPVTVVVPTAPPRGWAHGRGHGHGYGYGYEQHYRPKHSRHHWD